MYFLDMSFLLGIVLNPQTGDAGNCSRFIEKNLFFSTGGPYLRSMRLIMTLAASAALALSAFAQMPEGTVKSEQADFKVETVAGGLDTPWSLAFLPDGTYLVTERDGKLLHIAKDGTKTEIAGLPSNIHAKGQGGLFDIALAPDYAQSKRVFFSYAGSDKDGKNNTELARATFDIGKHRLSNVETIFSATPKVSGNNHYGGKILLANGYIYLTLGERFNYLEMVQEPDNHLGTVIRLNQDGSVPKDNPFVKDASAKPKEAFTWGHRNVQGIALRPGTRQIWTHEHGPKGGDEINILTPGANYGWPAITFGVDYSGFPISDKTEEDGMEQPLLQWTPSIAPSGMAFYNGDQFPKWKGDLFIGTLAATHLRRLEIKGDTVTEQEVLLPDSARIRDVRAGPDGFLYLLTDDTDGALMRLKPAK